MKSIKRSLAALALATVLLLPIGNGGSADAQNVLRNGTTLTSLGLGASLHTNSAGEQTGQVSLNLAADRCINGQLWDANSALTLGGQGILNLGGWGVSYFLGPRAGLHYHFIPELDTYVFAAIGLSGSHSNHDKSSSFGFGFNGGLGLRYMVTPDWGAFVEAGYGAALVNIGASFSF